MLRRAIFYFNEQSNIHEWRYLSLSRIIINYLLMVDIKTLIQSFKSLLLIC